MRGELERVPGNRHALLHCTSNTGALKIVLPTRRPAYLFSATSNTNVPGAGGHFGTWWPTVGANCAVTR